MNEGKKKKCEDIGFEHAWEDVTPNVIYPTYPPQYPPRTERCKNCGLTRKLITVQSEIREYQE